ncbi:helix-turn-helix transcriptional regulator [Chitinophaga oryzae]|uniref:Helix-turn-helix transcriptional regulator n=1 Tax=Chitinophaga oryzae TaxID=2725414 RepID=A0ABX6LIG0_9BACT|nr:helix-turn-helix transcriptional regulator [Chitinophaga oryzae]
MNIRNPEYIKQFGLNLRRIRKEQGRTRLDVAVAAGIDETALGKIERGEVNTTISTVEVLARALNKHPGELFYFK